jgi:hypothetical protein
MSTIYGSGKYKGGYCHIFALALHRIFGYQIAMLEDKDRVIERNDLHKWWAYVPHVFCMKNGYVIDAFGVRKPQTMITQSGKFTIAHPKIHKIDSRSLYNNSLFTVNFYRITKKNLAEAEEFILKHKERYTV